MLSGPAKTLATLFQGSDFDIEFDGAIEQAGRVFFDQVLVPTIVLRLPSAPKLLPPPATASESPAFLLPIRTPFPGSSPDAFNRSPGPAFPAASDVHDIGGDEPGVSTNPSRTTTVPRLLRTLLSLIRVQVDGTYAGSRAAAAAAAAQLSPPSSTTPVPAVRPADESLLRTQKTPSSTVGGSSAANNDASASLIPFHTQSWAGNKNGNVGSSAAAASAAVDRSSETRPEAEDLTHKRGNITFENSVKGGVQDGRWTVRWTCEVPISFMQLPTVAPALSLTASLSLLLSSTQLALLFDLPASADMFVGDQDLLSALSEGPVYPGEAPSDRAQRTKSNLARLPLSQLSAHVIGTKLLTPETTAREIKNRSQRNAALPPPPDAVMDDAEDSFGGDLSAPTGMPKAKPTIQSAGTGAVSPVRSAFALTVNSSDLPEPSAAFSRERRLLRRSFLRLLDVSSAVSVRLRTVLSPAQPLASSAFFPRSTSKASPGADGQGDQGDDLEHYEGDKSQASFVASEQPLYNHPFDEGGALLLCVELEHPLVPTAIRNSSPTPRPFGQISFEITKVKIDIFEPSSQAARDADAEGGAIVHAVKPAVNETLRAIILFDPASSHDAYGTPPPSFDRQKSTFPFVLSEGEQRNLVYNIEFIDAVPAVETPRSSRANSHFSAPVLPPPTHEPGQVRQVNIVVEARPLLPSTSSSPYLVGGERQVHPAAASDADADANNLTADRLPSFSSAWNCSVDVATARANLTRRNEILLAREHRQRLLEEEHVPVYLAQSAQ